MPERHRNRASLLLLLRRATAAEVPTRLLLTPSGHTAATATAGATASANSSALTLAETGSAFSSTLLAPLALLVGTGLLAFRAIRRS